MRALSEGILRGSGSMHTTKLIAGVLSFAILTGVAVARLHWIYLGLVLVPLLLYLCIMKPFIFPFGAYVLIIPFDEVLSLTGNEQGVTLTRMLGALAIAALILKGIVERKLVKPTLAMLFMTLFVIYGVTSIGWAQAPELVTSLIPTVLGLLLLYLVLGIYEIQKKEYDLILKCILAGGFIAAIYLIYSYLTGTMFHSSFRVSLIMGESEEDPNYFAYTLVIPHAVCVYMMLKQKKIAAMIPFMLVLCTMLFSFVLTGSRGGLMGALTVMFYYAITMNAPVRKRGIVVAAFLAIIFIISQLAPDVFFERIQYALETKGSGRSHLITVGVKALEKYWITGAGMGNFVHIFNEFSEYSPSYMGHHMAAHNLYLGIFVELGIIGITLFIAAMVYHYRAIKMENGPATSESTMLKAAFWGIVVISFSLDPLFRKAFWLLLMMILMHKTLSMGEKKTV